MTIFLRDSGPTLVDEEGDTVLPVLVEEVRSDRRCSLGPTNLLIEAEGKN